MSALTINREKKQKTLPETTTPNEVMVFVAPVHELNGAISIMRRTKIPGSKTLIRAAEVSSGLYARLYRRLK